MNARHVTTLQRCGLRQPLFSISYGASDPWQICPIKWSCPIYILAVASLYSRVRRSVIGICLDLIATRNVWRGRGFQIQSCPGGLFGCFAVERTIPSIDGQWRQGAVLSCYAAILLAGVETHLGISFRLSSRNSCHLSGSRNPGIRPHSGSCHGCRSCDDVATVRC